MQVDTARFFVPELSTRSPENRCTLLQGALAVRPVYLHKEGRIRALVFCALVALLALAFLEWLARRALLQQSGSTSIARPPGPPHPLPRSGGKRPAHVTMPRSNRHRTAQAFLDEGDVLSTDTIERVIARELSLPARQVSAAMALLDEGNTIPFIARYRKEVTSGLDEVQLRHIDERLQYLRKLAERKLAVRAEIESQDKLTEELSAQLDGATSLQAVEDLYRPYKPKRHTRAALARERGLERLAQALLAQERNVDLAALALQHIGPDVPDIESALAGARDILAEQISDDLAVRQSARQHFAATGTIASRRTSDEADPEGHYRAYHDFRVALRAVQPHQWLALRRGEKDGCLKVSLEGPDAAIVAETVNRFLKAPTSRWGEQIPAGCRGWL